MEEESEKTLLATIDNGVDVEEHKEEESANNETLLQAEPENNVEEKRPSPKTRFLRLFERKKISSSENLDAPPPKEQEPKRPILSGFFNRFRRGKYDVTDNIELGNTNGKKAGLASMETLDDSTKDPWNVENGSESPKLPKEEETKTTAEESKAAEAEAEKEKPIPIWHQIQNYNCSIDDIALLVGILIFFLLVGLIILFTFTGDAKKSASAPIRDGKVLAVTSCGYVEGLAEDSAIAFRGIPYAKPPTGDLRFEAAQPIEDLGFCWNGTLQAHKPASTCLQLNGSEIIGSEDCLFLDVITPEVRYINLLPVIVMVGSNSYTDGATGILRPSTRYARSKSVVFVRPNYRLGVLGFLALDSLSNSSNIPTSGNYALTDIIAALEWIKLNIQNFGGDPNSITVFGHRSGATLATALTAIPRASKLFNQVWASSGSSHFSGASLETSEKNNLEYAGLYPDCKEKSQWQLKDAADLTKKTPENWTKEHITTLPSWDENSTGFHDWIVLDGVYLKQHPEDVWKASTKTYPTIVIGTTAHAAFDHRKSSFLSQNLTEADIEKYVEDSKIGKLNLTEEAFKRYGKTKQGLIAMISDIRVVCPLFVQARSQSNIAFYVVTQTQEKDGLDLADVDSDVQAILGRYTSDTPEKRRYLDTMRQMFYYFVYHGKVNSYNPTKPLLEIGQDVAQRNDYPNCDFWITNQVVPHFAAYY